MHNFSNIRRHLHANPELSNQEASTSAYVVEQLKEIGVTEIYAGFAEYSVLAVIRNKEQGKTVMFRSELDALPITEVNEFEYCSKNHGISHKCGHDGHTATLLSLAHHLIVYPLEKGTILLVFQSAEEIGVGAKSIISSGILEQFSIDYAFAYHNLPSVPLGKAMTKPGILTPSVESFNLALLGKNCHASVPSNGINPALTIAQLVQFMATLHQPNKTLDKYLVTTPIHIHMGERAYGTSAGYAEMGYTIRTWTSQDLDTYKTIILNYIDAVCNNAKLTYKVEWFERFNANNNDAKTVDLIQAACQSQNITYETMTNPLDFGEDFGLFSDVYKGAMLTLGAGEHCPALHTSDYDFPDELIDIGRRLFYQIAQKVLV